MTRSRFPARDGPRSASDWPVRFRGPAEAAEYVVDLDMGAVAVGMSTLEHAAQALDAFGAP